MRNQYNHYEWLQEAISSHNSDECLLWPFGKDKDGYGKVRYYCQHLLAHRIAFYLTHGRWPEPCARHTCDNPPCFNPRHVIEGTIADNNHDTVKRNRQSRGESSGVAKITEEIVRTIRREYVPRSRTHGAFAMARRFGIDPTNVWLIVTRRHWKHVI